MPVRVRQRTTRNRFPSMQRGTEALRGLTVNVGVGGENAWLASIHEYGCVIKVTPKMRAYLHSQGLHLKPTTTEIRIPERSFLRNGYDKNIDDVIDISDATLPDVMIGHLSPEQFGKLIGLQLATSIKEYARDLREPPNSSFTIEQKGSSNPLVDTGNMINAITYWVKDNE